METASGIVLPDAYLKQVAAAAHDVGALFVLDCIASGTILMRMRDCDVDVLISAPQKGWSSTPCAAMVCLSERARNAMDATATSSFACDLKKWLMIAEGYVKGQHAYHATMPTDGLLLLRNAMLETRKDGFETTRQRQIELGSKMQPCSKAGDLPALRQRATRRPAWLSATPPTPICAVAANS